MPTIITVELHDGRANPVRIQTPKTAATVLDACRRKFLRGEGSLSPKDEPDLLLEDCDVVAGGMTYVFTPGAGSQGQSLPPEHPVVSQWQPFVDQAVAQLVAASVPALADTAVSDVITLGGSEPDINRLAQAAENLNVAVHPRVTALSSGKDWSSTEEWRADREDDSKNVKQRTRSIYHQLFGMVEIKRPAAFQSRLDTWRAQAHAQLLGVNYIVYQCVTQQPMGSGIPVLLTSFEDGQAILFTEKPDGDRDELPHNLDRQISDSAP
ncbi:hypothetical protein WJX82_008680 [Trebouxia sp. C0006]